MYDLNLWKLSKGILKIRRNKEEEKEINNEENEVLRGNTKSIYLHKPLN